VQEAGDHTIFIAEVEEVVVREGEPLLFFRGDYREIGDEVASSPTVRDNQQSNSVARKN